MGYEVDPEKLATIAGELRSGAEALEQVARVLPDAVDAGYSSDVANAALARVGKAGLVLARQDEVIASNIDEAKGTYHAADEHAEDQVQTSAEAMEDRRNREGPLLKTEPEQGSEQLKNHPKPIPAQPGRRPAPPPSPSN